MNTKHTPGPWQVHHDHGWLVVECDTGDLYVKIERGSAASKHMADARLIAAAPDLLEACIYLAEGIEACGVTGVYLDQARKAIAKAKGEQA